MKFRVKDYLITGLGGVIIGSNVVHFDSAHVLIGIAICVVGLILSLDQ